MNFCSFSAYVSSSSSHQRTGYFSVVASVLREILFLCLLRRIGVSPAGNGKDRVFSGSASLLLDLVSEESRRLMREKVWSDTENGEETPGNGDSVRILRKRNQNGTGDSCSEKPLNLPDLNRLPQISLFQAIQTENVPIGKQSHKT